MAQSFFFMSASLWAPYAPTQTVLHTCSHSLSHPRIHTWMRTYMQTHIPKKQPWRVALKKIEWQWCSSLPYAGTCSIRCEVKKKHASCRFSCLFLNSVKNVWRWLHARVLVCLHAIPLPLHFPTRPFCAFLFISILVFVLQDWAEVVFRASGAYCAVCLSGCCQKPRNQAAGGEAAAVAPPLFLAKSHDHYISPFFLL